MKAMRLRAPRTPLVLDEIADPEPGEAEVQIRVGACAVCRTDLHVVEGERVIRSVANLTRRDGEESLALAPRVPVTTRTTGYPLARANEALDDLRAGRVEGAAVVLPR
jgi:propanol-preferring alcohol dehydrogenase